MNDNPFVRQGWECPKCGRVYSPSTSMCLYCGNEQTTVTTGLIPSAEEIKNAPNGATVATPLIMRDLTPEEQEEYNKVLDKLYEPTELNLFDIGVKNNFNKIKRYNKDELAEFITDLTNYGKYPCANCGYYEGGDSYDYCPNDCVQGVKLWLEKEVSE